MIPVAPVHVAEILRRFRQIDRALQAVTGGGDKGKGFPATSPWWHRTITRFYESGVLQLVARVGRRGGKSSTLCRLAVCEALYGQHDIPSGDRGVVAIVSARRKDALDRLRTIKAILDALEVRYTASKDVIDLTDRPISFHVFTASIAGVSGFTSIFVLLDEVAKWKDKSTGANPANVVIESIVPTTATMPEARVVMISSPMGLVDAHADAFALGDTADQVVAFAPTWEANPTLTEARTRKLAQGNEIAWAREYAAIPQAEDELSVFEGRLVSKATRKVSPITNTDLVKIGFTERDYPPDSRHRYVATIDPATRGNAWTLIIACLTDKNVRRICLAREWRGSKAKPLKPGEVFAAIKRLLDPYGLRLLFSDQFSEDSLREIARQHGLVLLVDKPWTPQRKADAYETMRTLFQEERIELPSDPQVTADLLGVRQKLNRNGIVYELASSGGRHSDYAPAVAMAVMASIVPAIPIPSQLTVNEQAKAMKGRYIRHKESEKKKEERRNRLRPGARLGH